MVTSNNTTTSSSGLPPAPDWNGCATMAKAALSDAVNGWIDTSEVQADSDTGTCGINVTQVTLKPGSLRGGYGYEAASMREYLKTVSGITSEIATVFAKELWHAWKAWASQFQVSFPGVPPSFAAWPGSETGPVKLAQYPKVSLRGTLVPDVSFANWPLSWGSSTDEVRLSASRLATNILSGLGPLLQPQASAGSARHFDRLVQMSQAGTTRYGTIRMARAEKLFARTTNAPTYAPVLQPSPDAAVNDLAAWVSSKFMAWKSSANLTNLWCNGKVPTFAPPYVPVGPVLGGRVWGGSLGAAAISSPPFPYE